MFTGIVQARCPVVSLDDQQNLRRLGLALGPLAEGLQLGASVACNGVCLTASAIEADRVCFDVIAETLSLTNLGELDSGHLVNVERSFRVGDEVGGHILSGHVACAVPVTAVETAENLRIVKVGVPPEWFRYVHLKGFVALDGASLTISHHDSDRCEMGVSLIPETIERTSLGNVVVGDRINLEVDAQTQAVVETVERVLASADYAHLRRSEA